jgi:hypothetical protein
MKSRFWRLINLFAVISCSLTFGSMVENFSMCKALNITPYYDVWFLTLIVVFLVLNVLICGASMLGYVDE